MKIYFETIDLQCITPCPYRIKNNENILMIGSYGCIRYCKFFKSENEKEKYIECNHFGIEIPDELFEI